jgi:hypothetical protein
MRKINKKIQKNINIRATRSAVANFIDWSIPVSIFLISILMISYITLVSMTTIRSASNKNTESKISKLTEEINKIENNLSEITNNITPKLAENLGFYEAKKIEYLPNKPVKAAFKVNEI